MDTLQFFRTVIILLLITFCESQPVEPSTENSNDVITTLCPEELALRKLQSSNNILENVPGDETDIKEKIEISTRNSEGTSTIGPQLEEDLILTDNPQEQNDKNSPQTNTKNSDQTTICPEEVEKSNQEETERNSQKTEDNIQEELLESVKIDKEENEDPDFKESAEEITTICPEELERRKLENIEENFDGKLETEKIQQKPSSIKIATDEEFESHSIAKNSEDTTTICPEELEKRKLEEIEENSNQDLEKTEDNLQEKIDEEKARQPITENSGETTTICPEELEKRKNPNEVLEISNNIQVDNDENASRETDDNSAARRKIELLSQEYLIKYKELVNKAQNIKHFKTKRQTSDYSYYMSQPTYNSQGVAVSNTGLNQQQQQSYNAQAYNSQGITTSKTTQNQLNYNSQGFNSQNYNNQGGLSASNNNVKTYQQIRQYQNAQQIQKQANFYPKTYQNHLKPVKTYRNPSTYVRYPSNGSFKNYYRLNNIGNRRQFQGARPIPNTSARPNIRVTRKKKFKPSPVFA